jgi:hypothetical protein
MVFYVFRLFWCADIKNNLKKIKKIYFNIFLNKNTLNRHCYHNSKEKLNEPNPTIKLL